MNSRARLTAVGAVLTALLVLALLALFLGSGGLQGAGFVVALIVVIVLIGDRLPRMRVGGGHDLGMDSPTMRRRRRGPDDAPEDEGFPE